MKMRYSRTAAALLVSGVISLITVVVPAARADEPVKPGISAEASAALKQMGKTLSANDLSVQARTIRVYQDDDGDLLHVFHTMKVVAD